MTTVALRTACAFVMLGFSVSMAADEGGTYRHSYWYECEFLYIQDGVALVRTNIERTDGSTGIWYELTKAKWGGAPELVGQTGDVKTEELLLEIDRAEYLPEQGLVVLRGKQPKDDKIGCVGILHLGGSKIEIISEKEWQTNSGPKKELPLVIDWFFRWAVNNRETFGRKH